MTDRIGRRPEATGWQAKPDIRAKYAWPLGLGAAAAAWYGTESLRHRRESGHGYELCGADGLDVRDPGFMRAAEALTAAPISWGSEVELLDQRRPDLPLLPGHDPQRGADAVPAHVRVLAR